MPSWEGDSTALGSVAGDGCARAPENAEWRGDRCQVFELRHLAVADFNPRAVRVLVA